MPATNRRTSPKSTTGAKETHGERGWCQGGGGAQGNASLPPCLSGRRAEKPSEAGDSPLRVTCTVCLPAGFTERHTVSPCGRTLTDISCNSLGVQNAWITHLIRERTVSGSWQLCLSVMYATLSSSALVILTYQREHTAPLAQELKLLERIPEP